MDQSEEVSIREKLHAIHRVSAYRPVSTVLLAVFSVATALLEGIGLTFIVPIIETVQADDQSAIATDGLLATFVEIYAFLGIPFALGYVIIGVSAIMTLRYTASFLVSWLQVSLGTWYLAHIQTTAYDHALDANVTYFDKEGSDEILNALVTQSEYASAVIGRLVSFLQRLLLIATYFMLALYLAPVLALIAVTALSALAVLLRSGLAPGYEIGNRVADANERIQEYAQAGTQGIRDVKLYGLTEEFRQAFHDTVKEFAGARIQGYRNQSALQNSYRLVAAVAMFTLVYFAVTYAALSLATLGVFLFTMFRLAPQISSLNSQAYRIEQDLPHLVRTQRFLDELTEYREPDTAARDLPTTIDGIVFDDVTFAYEATSDTPAIRDVSFTVDSGEFAAFVGPSGAGKSTIASLLARLYEPEDGSIEASGVPIAAYDLRAWRSRVAVVRQHPYLFDASLRWNVTVGNRDATQADIERACEAAQVTEFLDDLPNGYVTMLGDNGIRLSGGQRQRIAIARALLKHADVLVLDEATSDLDTALEHQIHDAIATQNHDQMLVVIAHRLSTVTDADRIHTIKDGQIVESGTHGELLSRQGTYAALYRAQVTDPETIDHS